MQMTSNPTVEEVPEYSCYYYNENDPRVCVCGRDKAQCGKRGCVPNLATTGGKIIQFLLSAAIIAMVVFMIIQQLGKAKKKWKRSARSCSFPGVATLKLSERANGETACLLLVCMRTRYCFNPPSIIFVKFFWYRRMRQIKCTKAKVFWFLEIPLSTKSA